MNLKRAAEGLTTITIGGILLANTLGYLPWSVWWNVLSLWPLLIVALGIELVGKGMGATWLRIVSSLIVILGLLYGALVMQDTSARWPFIMSVDIGESTPFDLSEPHIPRVKLGSAEITGGAGTFSVAAGDDLVSAEGETPFREPEFSAEVDGREVDVSVGLGSGTWPSGAKSRFDVLLDRRVVWDLGLDIGVSDAAVDLTKLPISRLSLKSGVSDTLVTLGDPARFASGVIPVSIDAGLGTLRVRIPERAQARVSVSGGLNVTNVDSSLEKFGQFGDDRVWQTQGFSEDDAYYDIEIGAGVGTIDVEVY